jgi:hypothetical protein
MHKILTDRQTDRHDKANTRFFCLLVNVPTDGGVIPLSAWLTVAGTVNGPYGGRRDRA